MSCIDSMTCKGGTLLYASTEVESLWVRKGQIRGRIGKGGLIRIATFCSLQGLPGFFGVMGSYKVNGVCHRRH